MALFSITLFSCADNNVIPPSETPDDSIETRSIIEDEAIGVMPVDSFIAALNDYFEIDGTYSLHFYDTDCARYYGLNNLHTGRITYDGRQYIIEDEAIGVRKVKDGHPTTVPAALADIQLTQVINDFLGIKGTYSFSLKYYKDSEYRTYKVRYVGLDNEHKGMVTFDGKQYIIEDEAIGVRKRKPPTTRVNLR